MKSMKRKWIAIGIILLFVGTCIIPAIAQEAQKPLPTSRGSWLYVGGSGPGNYSKIQDAIDNASDNDTIIVFSGIYYEHLIVQKTLCLKGVNSSDGLPIVDANESGDAILLQAPGIIVDGFVTQNAGSGLDSDRAGIQVSAKYCTVKNCISKGVSYNGIYMSGTQYANYCQIINNTVVGTLYGISAGGDIQYLNVSGNYVTGCTYPIMCHGAPFYSIIRNNIVTGNKYGIIIYYGLNMSVVGNRIYNNVASGIWIRITRGYNIIKYNVIYNNGGGIYLGKYGDFNVSYNLVYSNSHDCGICIVDVNICEIYMNQIEQNYPFGVKSDMIFSGSTNRNNIIDNPVFFIRFGARFSYNYWGRPLDSPKIIFGRRGVFGLIPGIIFDWHPAQEPYDITGMR